MDATENLADCCTIFQFLGILYFSVKRLSLETLNRYPSKIYIIQFLITLLILTLQSILYTFKIWSDLTIAVNAKNALSYVIQNLAFFGLILLSITATVQSYIKFNSVKKIFVNCIKISQISQQYFGHIINYKSIKIFHCRKMLKFFIFYIVAQIMVLSFEMYHDIEDAIMRNSFALISSIFLNMILNKFVFFVDLVNCNLKYLTIVLNKSCRESNQRFKNLWKIYNLIEENVELINKCLGLTILMQIFIVSLTLAIFIYRLILTFAGHSFIGQAAGELIKIFS